MYLLLKFVLGKNVQEEYCYFPRCTNVDKENVVFTLRVLSLPLKVVLDECVFCIRKYCLLFRSVFKDNVVLTGEIPIKRMFSLLYAQY
jgi:hypothetical protein